MSCCLCNDTFRILYEMCQKAARQINALKRLSKFPTFESRMVIFRSFMMSNLNYCSLVRHACGVQSTRKLEKLQERALRFVYLDKVSSYDDLLTKANLTTLHLGRLNMLATELYKSVHKLDIYKTKTTVTNRRLRGRNNLHIPRVNSTTYGLAAYQDAKIWNGLSQDLTSAISFIIIIIIIIRQPLCPVIGRRPQHAVSKLPCLVLSSAISCRSSICQGRLSAAWLVSLFAFSCNMVSKW